MFRMQLTEIVEKIHSARPELTTADINAKIDAKVKQLSGLISREGAAHIIANELHVKIFEQIEGLIKIDAIIGGMRNVETQGKVQRVFEVREFQTDSGSGKVGSLIIADQTASIRVTFWHDKTDYIAQIKEGDIVKIKSGYVRDNRGTIEVHLNDRSEVEINPPGVSIEGVSTQAKSTRKRIDALDENETNVELLATVVQTFEPRFFEICPECSRRARPTEKGFECNTHNVVTPKFGFVLSIVLDDGSGNIRSVFFNKQVLDLVKQEENAMMMYRENIQLFESVKNDLLGKVVKVTGRVQRNAMFDRLEFTVNDVNPNPNPAEELK